MPKENVVITKKPNEEKEDTIGSLLSRGKPLKLTPEEYKRISQEIKEEFQAICDERRDINGEDYDCFLENMDNQKYGRMPKSAMRAYNLDTGITRIKCGDISRTIPDALLSVEPIISVSPRLGFAMAGGTEICEQQQEFIDNAIDEIIPLRKPITLAADSAVYKKVGIIKWFHKVTKEPRTRKEVYTGKPVQVGINPDKTPIIENKPLEDFLLVYAEAIKKEPEKYEWIIKTLMEGKTATFDIEYDEIDYDDPYPIFIDNANFYVRKSVDGYDGLCETKLIAERRQYSYYELKKLEKEHDFINVDDLTYQEDGKTRRKNYTSETYNILECVFVCKAKDNDEMESKIVVWLSEDKEFLYLGGVYFPFTVLSCYYVPHYVSLDSPGFYPSGVAEQLTDIHLSKNAILNHTLESAHMSTTITPITPKDSPAAQQFENNLWTNGLPIYAHADEISFLSNLIKPLDTSTLLVLSQELGRLADEISGSSGLRTGRESALDPNAPASKTAMLLAESGKDIKSYVDIFKDGFNIDAFVILRMYYEISQKDDEYLSRRMRQSTGKDMPKITSAALIAKTTIQSQAMAYDLNQAQSKKEDVIMNAFLTKEMMIVSNPDANYERIKAILAGFGPKWKALIPKLLPSPEEFKSRQAMIALQATAQYMNAKAQEAQITKVPPQLDPNELIALISKLQTMATAPSEVTQQMQEASQ